MQPHLCKRQEARLVEIHFIPEDYTALADNSKKKKKKKKEWHSW
jgi:hypothetical protein